MQIEISPGVLKELEYMIILHKKAGAPNPFDNVPDLNAYILTSVADGSRRPVPGNAAYSNPWGWWPNVQSTGNTAPITAPRPITKDSSSGPQ
ncbi:hypothetical protein Nwat_2411 [Nitrosococcus watsonii C-113]|uniref:Uncharacterized protein n=1 Tax=Nitrosococcus watsoni (strain C-113) TaxID=105559 RepID=D8K988_NITWC|nr:hypothetical protein Nwat_2411 [Nitrosococcus watsonii C-113]